MADKARIETDTNIQVKTRSNTHSSQKFTCINFLMYSCKGFFMVSWFGLTVKEYFSKKLEQARIRIKPE